MNELLKAFVEWAKNPKQYPLLFLLSISGVYWFVGQYYGLSELREIIYHKTFILFCGIIILITGATYTLIDFKKRQVSRYLVGGSLSLIGISGIVIGIFLSMPYELESDRLVVSIAGFDYVKDENTGATKNDSNSIRVFFFAELNKKVKAGVPIEIKRSSIIVPYGANINEGMHLARRLGRSREDCAHIIVWGKVGRYEDKLSVWPVLTVSQQFGNMDTLGVDFDDIFDKPLAFPKSYSSQIADIITTICGIAFFKNAQWHDAIKSFTQAERYEAKAMLGMTFLKLNDFQKSVIAFQDALNYVPQDLAALNALGIINLKLKQYEKAQSYFLNVLKIDKKNMAALNNIALCYMSNGDYKSAIMKFSEILQENENPTVLSNKAFCLLETGDIKTAIQCWEQSLLLFKTYQEYPDKQFDIQDTKAGLAVGYYASGRIKDAKSRFLEVRIDNSNYGSEEYLQSILWPKKAIYYARQLISVLDQSEHEEKK